MYIRGRDLTKVQGLNNIQVAAQRPVVLVIPRPEEDVDVALKVFREGEDPLYVLLESTSAMDKKIC